ncbi:tetratricopeptide repeat protein [Thiohalocapsa marina]|nr:sel1 repeat family protein [Thiohalocapsa marina]
MTYLAPRRSVKTTQRDCAIRGGEYVLFDRSDYRSALQALLPQARAGDAVAQTYVGEIHERGLGLSAPDFAAAATWYAKAAEAGHRPAQIRLGSLYERGLGVPRNQAAALNWYRRATGLDEDRLIFESDLKARREAFRRELALRNQVAASLKQQLRQAQQVVTRGNMDSEAPGAQPRQAELQALIESQQREAESLATQKQTELKAVQLLQQQGQDAGEGSSEKAAQMGKLELTLRQQIDGLRDTSERLVMRD